VKWFRAAADQGLAEAQFNLAQRYQHGQEVASNLVAAYKWFTLAGQKGIPDAKQAQIQSNLSCSQSKLPKPKPKPPHSGSNRLPEAEVIERYWDCFFSRGQAVRAPLKDARAEMGEEAGGGAAFAGLCGGGAGVAAFAESDRERRHVLGGVAGRWGVLAGGVSTPAQADVDLCLWP